jgi:glutamate dehydrogenase/leucine dehydrogenase
MTDSFRDIHRVSKDRGVPLRVAAYLTAVQRVAASEVNRGFAG